MRVEVIYSKRRRKTLSAALYGETLKVRAPKNISKRELKEHINDFETYFRVERANKSQTLEQRAQLLGERYLGEALKIKEIKFVTNQRSRFGSCSPQKRVIRLSSRLLEVPEWVLDYVVIHELAHLREPDHSERFWRLVNGYKLTERAKGYLMAIGLWERYHGDSKSPV